MDNEAWERSRKTTISASLSLEFNPFSCKSDFRGTEVNIAT